MYDVNSMKAYETHNITTLSCHIHMLWNAHLCVELLSVGSVNSGSDDGGGGDIVTVEYQRIM